MHRHLPPSLGSGEVGVVPSRRGVLRGCLSRFFASSVAFALLEKLGSPLSPFGVNMSTLQDSLYGTDCRFAPPPRRGTPLRHPRLPESSGSLLRGSLAI